MELRIVAMLFALSTMTGCILFEETERVIEPRDILEAQKAYGVGSVGGPAELNDGMLKDYLTVEWGMLVTDILRNGETIAVVESASDEALREATARLAADPSLKGIIGVGAAIGLTALFAVLGMRGKRRKKEEAVVPA